LTFYKKIVKVGGSFKFFDNKQPKYQRGTPMSDNPLLANGLVVVGNTGNLFSQKLGELLPNTTITTLNERDVHPDCSARLIVIVNKSIEKIAELIKNLLPGAQVVVCQ
jgi:hypothetical protein